MQTHGGRGKAELELVMGGMKLEADVDWAYDAQGAVLLLGQGLRRLRLHLMAAEDPARAAAGALDDALHLEVLAEEAFESSHWRGSLFRVIPERLIDAVAERCGQRLAAYLTNGAPLLARRAAKILVRLYPKVGSFADLRMLLHCYFHARSLTPRKFGRYVKERLMLAEDAAGESAKYLVMRNELEAFVAEFRPQLVVAGWTETEFLASIETLAATLDRHRGKMMGVSRGRVMEVEPGGGLVAILHDYFRSGAGNFRRFDRLAKAALDAAANPLEVMRGNRLLRDGIAEFLESTQASAAGADQGALAALERRLDVLRDRRLAEFDGGPELLVGGDG